MQNLKGLYAVADAENIGTDYLVHAVQQVLNAGVKIIQYRDKKNDATRRFICSQKLQAITKKHSCILIINDDVQLAKEIDADGVHLGNLDCDIIEARSILGANKIIGASCYNVFENALKVEQSSADYVAFGSFFPSPTKPNAPQAKLDLIARAKKELSIPVCAIGGIRKNNISQLLDAGVDMVAMISALFNTPDPNQTATEYLALINKFDINA